MQAGCEKVSTYEVLNARNGWVGNFCTAHTAAVMKDLDKRQALKAPPP